MTASLKKIADDLMKLPPGDRIELAETLILNTPEFASAEIEDAWDAELKRRIDAAEAGREEMVPSKKSFAAARKALNEARRPSLRRKP
jgi:putative addiction module component (TIGR02574 family)